MCRAGEEYNVRCEELVRDDAHIVDKATVIYLFLSFFFFSFLAARGTQP